MDWDGEVSLLCHLCGGVWKVWVGWRIYIMEVEGCGTADFPAPCRLGLHQWRTRNAECFGEIRRWLEWCGINRFAGSVVWARARKHRVDNRYGEDANGMHKMTEWNLAMGRNDHSFA
jgi:hypothetical protein